MARSKAIMIGKEDTKILRTIQFHCFGLLAFSPCKAIISIKQEANYMQCFHPLAKKIKSSILGLAVNFLTKYCSVRKCQCQIFLQFYQAVCQEVVLSFQVEFLTNLMFLIENLSFFPELFLCFAFAASE